MSHIFSSTQSSELLLLNLTAVAQQSHSVTFGVEFARKSSPCLFFLILCYGRLLRQVHEMYRCMALSLPGSNISHPHCIYRLMFKGRGCLCISRADRCTVWIKKMYTMGYISMYTQRNTHSAWLLIGGAGLNVRE